MTTATPLTNNTQLSVNETTKSQEHNLYQSSGAIVAAIVVGVIIIFTVVLLILKTYNRRTRVRRELEPKGSKLAVPPPVGHSSHSPAQQPSVTFIPVDIHLQSRALPCAQDLCYSGKKPKGIVEGSLPEAEAAAPSRPRPAPPPTRREPRP